MSLAIFGLILLGAMAALAYKNTRALATALVGVMLGLTIAGSGGALAEPSHALVDQVRAGLDSAGATLFGGGQ
ncbi:hypothetical protein [Allonocardiopsis opalescens]|uniref:Uncharacterized protein n=1 Tax=Allonocardiopsis opalescens TaxID=1144618 RepID=A0A2T0Q769_9ACTN|nr:hypothetical protein [Allonocardiopsis opalescens]PRX99658.1 hypothetical protein CLV72_103263 [Allonocardiopsis opalescens]